MADRHAPEPETGPETGPETEPATATGGQGQAPSATEPPTRGEVYVESVLSLAELVPAGRATTYGAIADAVGEGGPRQVGRVMALYGGAVAWWRVVRADGGLPPPLAKEALARYRAEETPLRGSVRDAGSLRVDLRRAWWQPPPRRSSGQPLSQRQG